jgi:hypothetical protein
MTRKELYFQQNICIVSWKETILSGWDEGVISIYLFVVYLTTLSVPQCV